MTELTSDRRREDAWVRLAQGAYHWLQRRLGKPTVDAGLRNLADNLAYLLGEHGMRITFVGDELAPWVRIHPIGDVDDARSEFPADPDVIDRVRDELELAYLRLGYEAR